MVQECEAVPVSMRELFCVPASIAIAPFVVIAAKAGSQAHDVRVSRHATPVCRSFQRKLESTLLLIATRNPPGSAEQKRNPNGFQRSLE
jgi:hypothetical protein